MSHRYRGPKINRGKGSRPRAPIGGNWSGLVFEDNLRRSQVNYWSFAVSINSCYKRHDMAYLQQSFYQMFSVK